MAENRIQYSARNYEDFRTSLLDITRKYYPDIANNFNDASVGSWFLDIFADVADAINYHIDRTYQETSVTAAGQRKSLLNIARNNGVKVPGKKAALVEIELSCELPLNKQGQTSNGNLSDADESYAPYIKRGTSFTTGRAMFELVNDVDFSQQFDENGMSNRQIYPNRDSNGNIVSYTYKKLAVAVAGQTKIYKRIITRNDIKPFMSILLQDNDILGIESIIVKQGTDLSTDPKVYEYDVDEETFTINEKPVNRYFEVENLVEQYRFGYETTGEDEYNPVWDEEVGTYMLPDNENSECEYTKECECPKEVELVVRKVARGQWKPLKNKFITEYTDNGSLKITFGAGIKNEYGEIPTEAHKFTQYMMSRMTANDYMGVLPEPDTTMYILYRVGGGEMSNIAQDTLNTIVNLSMTIEGNCDDSDDARKKRDVRTSLRVTNTTPSYGGKDEPSDEELRQLIKYHCAAQNRCVTLHDYIAKINEIPAKYGTPFRISAVEENNKVVIYTLGLNPDGRLESKLAETVANNIKEYLKMYKTINDFVEIRSGKIINVSFEIDVFVDKAYEKSEVVKRIIDIVRDYMDVRKHLMADDYFIGDLEKEISKLDGVQNLIEIRVYNMVGSENGYSDDATTQQLVDTDDCCQRDYPEGSDNSANRIDLQASDKVLFTEANSMIEVRYPDKDIKVHVRQRES